VRLSVQLAQVPEGLRKARVPGDACEGGADPDEAR